MGSLVALEVAPLESTLVTDTQNNDKPNNNSDLVELSTGVNNVDASSGVSLSTNNLEGLQSHGESLERHKEFSSVTINQDRPDSEGTAIPNLWNGEA